ncbi:MAG: TylF/MycF/NovP-related O-methyltransferase [Sideroxyarcus sp.]|nr:TylF/MycF/NovP-related O-methyltransferase [Sideroxyarcus sp.]
MTTKWKPDGLFTGATVAIIGDGPSMTQELADSVRHLPRVCARLGCRWALDADIGMAIDAPPNLGRWPGDMPPSPGFWPWALQNFRGKLVTAGETDELPPEVGSFWHRWEMVTVVDPTHVIELRQNFMSAMHIAEQGGAAKILLVGLDTDAYDTMYMGQGLYFGKGIEQLTAKLRAKGIVVEHIKTLEDARLHAVAPVIKPLALIAGPRLESLLSLLAKVRGLDGCVAELGVYKAGTLKAIAEAAPDKTCFGFDTWTGMPAERWAEGDNPVPGALADVSFESVQRAMPPNCKLVRGLFPESAAGIEERFCLAHVDMDYGKSTADAIEWLRPRMVSGGLIVFDDWHEITTPGVAKAIRKAGLKVVESAPNQCYWTAP